MFRRRQEPATPTPLANGTPVNPALAYIQRPSSVSNRPPLSQSQKQYRRPFRSRRIPVELLGQHTPWFKTPAGKSSLRRSYWTFLAFMTLGILGGAAMLVLTWLQIPKHEYCLILDEQFSGDSIDTSVWSYDLQVGGFNNHEFEMTTASSSNSFVEDGRLYIVPTLTNETIGNDAVLSGYTMDLSKEQGGCTGATAASCAVTSDNSTIIPPIQSARLTTKNSKSIRFGRVEVKARMAKGDWLWPAIWMMPLNDTYGAWPRSGEIDIAESKGNLVTARSDNFGNVVSSSMHWGPDATVDRWGLTTKMLRFYRNFFYSNDYTFGLDWDENGLYTWQGSRAKQILHQDFKKSFWNIGDFSSVTVNGSYAANPWSASDHPKAAPFDQPFYLILDVAAGGTSGYWGDKQTKPWSNTSPTAARDFWDARDSWYSTWPSSPKERGMSVDYVKMWSIKEPGQSCPTN